MLRLFKNSLFIVFYLLELRLVTLELFSAKFIPALGVGLLVLLFSLGSRRNTLKTLYLFFALIPLLHGLRMLAILPNLPLVDLCFAGIYIAWLPKYYFSKTKKSYQSTTIEYLVDCLGIVIIISLLTMLSQYPIVVSWHALTNPDILAQEDRFWSIEAARIFLQGLIIFRIYIVESNSTDLDLKKWFFSALYVHLFFIACFGLIQIFLGLPETHILTTQRTITSPFDDRHSFGSILVMYFFILSGRLTSSGKDIAKRYLPLIFMGIIAFLIFRTGSVVTLATLLLCSAVILIRRLNWKITIVFILLFSGPLLYFNFNPKLQYKITNPNLNRIARRLLIKNVPKFLSGRFENADQALGIISTYPISGSGIGSFYRVARYYHFSNQAHPKQIENAHNYYLQLASEAGLPAIALFVSILFLLFISGLKGITTPSLIVNEKKGLLMGVAAYLITMLTSHPLLLPVQQFCFWMILSFTGTAILNRNEKNAAGSSCPYIFKLISAILFVFLLVSGAIYKNHKFIESPAFGYGGFQPENINKQPVQWTGKYFATKTTPHSNILSITFSAPLLNNQNDNRGLEFTLSINDTELDKLYLFSSGWQQRNYYIPNIKEQQVIIKINVDRTFNPAKLGINCDRRDLGILLQPITFLHIIPKTDFGFFQWEKTPSPQFPEWEGIKTADARWMGRQASINISSLHGKNFKIYYLCAQPDLKSHPATIKIFTDNIKRTQTNCQDNQWHKIVLRSAQLSNKEILTIILNRTYNPKANGQSDDKRNLGLLIVTEPSLKTNKQEKEHVPENG